MEAGQLDDTGIDQGVFETDNHDMGKFLRKKDICAVGDFKRKEKTQYCDRDEQHKKLTADIHHKSAVPEYEVKYYQ